MRKVVFFLFYFSFCSVYSQTQFWQDNFEGSPTSGTRTPEGSGGIGTPATSYFKLTDGSTVSQSVSFTGKQGTNYWAGEDHNAAGTGLPSAGAGTDDSLNELTITWTNINITGKSGLSFKGSIAANNTNSPWDTKNSVCDGNSTTNTDYIIIQYRINGAAWTDLIRFFNKGGNGVNKDFYEDTNNDACGDGTKLTNVFGEFTKVIIGTGNILDLRINVYSEGNNEEWGIDNFRLFETILGTNEFELSSKFKIYPNPVKGFFKITSDFDGDYQIINQLGSVVKKFSVNANVENVINTQALSKGIYFIKDINSEKSFSQKIIID